MAEVIESLDEIDEVIRHASQSDRINPDLRAAFIDGLLDARLRAARQMQDA